MEQEAGGHRLEVGPDHPEVHQESAWISTAPCFFEGERAPRVSKRVRKVAFDLFRVCGSDKPEDNVSNFMLSVQTYQRADGHSGKRRQGANIS